MKCDRVWRGARLATMAAPPGLGIVEKGAVASRDGRIVYAGAEADAPTLRRRPRRSIARAAGSRPA